jgi:hypothetical protein
VLDLGFDIARHGQVDHEDGAALALLERLHGTQADDGQGGGGAADDGVELVQMLGQVGQAHGAGAELGASFSPRSRCGWRW